MPEASDTQPSSPGAVLMAALFSANLERVRLAVKRGASVDDPTAIGLRPLEIAVRPGAGPIVDFLFEQGATYPESTHGGRTLLIQAKANNAIDVVEALKRHGATPGLTDGLLVMALRLKKRRRQKAGTA